MKEGKNTQIDHVTKVLPNLSDSQDSTDNSNYHSSRNFVLKKDYFGLKNHFETQEGEFLSFPNFFQPNPIVSYYFYQNEDEKKEDESDSPKTNSSNGSFEKESDSSSDNTLQFQSETPLNLLTYNFPIKQSKSRRTSHSLLENEIQVLVEAIETKNGCKLYQSRIKQDKLFGNEILYPVLKPVMLRLIKNDFGNYLYKEFLEVLNPHNFCHFINFVSFHFEEIAYCQVGSTVIQKLLEKANLEDKIGTLIYQKISEKLEGNVAKLSMDDNASYIVQKYLSAIKSPYSDFIYKEIFESFLSVSVTKLGCCTVKKCFKYGTPRQKEKFCELGLSNLFSLIHHPYGNYILQDVIIFASDTLVKKIFGLLSGNILTFCVQKYSSNVIEKFFEIKYKPLVNFIANFIAFDAKKILFLICNEYGNFIVQKILAFATDNELKAKIVKIIKCNIFLIKDFQPGLSFLKKIQENIIDKKVRLC